MVADHLAEVMSKIEMRERASKGNQPGASSAILPNLSKVDTRKEAAKEAGIGERTLDAVKLIKDAADSPTHARAREQRKKRGGRRVHHARPTRTREQHHHPNPCQKPADNPPQAATHPLWYVNPPQPLKAACVDPRAKLTAFDSDA
jgi:hypothetical protein